MRLICFDLEGPLSPQDNAYELMKLFPEGGKVFEIISRYDDLLTLEGKPGYEPGDTLALIVPFLVCHQIKEKDIVALAEKANLTQGARELIAQLTTENWGIFCISTSYEQYALHITGRLNIPRTNVSCTSLPLDQFAQELGKEDSTLVQQIESAILNLKPVTDDKEIKRHLDHFFWEKLPDTNLGKLVKQVKPVGGERKVEALKHFAQAEGKSLSHWVVVGDSITDFKMLQAVNRAGGLAIAFNANEYALPYSTVGLASSYLSDLWEILEVWQEGERLTVETWVKETEQKGGRGDRGNYHWLSGVEDFSQALAVHKRIRRLVREEAAKLG